MKPDHRLVKNFNNANFNHSKNAYVVKFERYAKQTIFKLIRKKAHQTHDQSVDRYHIAFPYEIIQFFNALQPT